MMCMILFATNGLSKKWVFRRFDQKYYTNYWYTYGGMEALCFIPNQNVIVCGFGLFNSHDVPKFEAQYWIYVDDKLVEGHDDVITCTDFDDKYVTKIDTKNLIEVKAGSKLEITAKVASNIGTSSYVYVYYGYSGENFAQVENENMGLWNQFITYPISNLNLFFNCQNPSVK